MNAQKEAGSGRAPQMLTREQAGERLCCSRRYVDELIRGGRIKAVRISRKLVRIFESDLAEFCQSLPPLHGCGMSERARVVLGVILIAAVTAALAVIGGLIYGGGA